MRLPKRRPQRRRRHRAVRKIPHALAIRRLGVKVPHHVPPRQLAKSPRLHPQQLQRSIHPGQIFRSDLLKDIIRKSGPPVRTRNGGQAKHVYVWRFEPADHVSGVQAPHAVGDDVDALAVGLLFNVVA